MRRPDKTTRGRNVAPALPELLPSLPPDKSPCPAGASRFICAGDGGGWVGGGGSGTANGVAWRTRLPRNGASGGEESRRPNGRESKVEIREERPRPLTPLRLCSGHMPGPLSKQRGEGENGNGQRPCPSGLPAGWGTPEVIPPPLASLRGGLPRLGVGTSGTGRGPHDWSRAPLTAVAVRRLCSLLRHISAQAERSVRFALAITHSGRSPAIGWTSKLTTGRRVGVLFLK